MTTFSARYNYLRKQIEGEHAKVEYVELFFDLVFVFAVTQLSHGLIAHLDLKGAIQTGFLLLAVWWVWMYTTWVTNWLDPAHVPVRFLLLAMMAAGLVLSASIPDAFDKRAIAFAIAYASMQVGRSLFMVWASRGHGQVRAENFTRITIWLASSGVLWIAGAFAGHEARIVLWLAALAIEYIAPWAYFYVPGLGASALSSWDVDTHHLSERCGLFIIIALGESILITGATFAGLEWTASAIGAFAASFVATLAMWWIYFAIGQDFAAHRFSKAQDVGRLARLAYTYFHIPIVAGIILSAAGDELVLDHPEGHTELSTLLCVAGGAAVYLLGNTLFKMAFFGRPPFSHLVGMAALAVLAVLTGPLHLSPLALALATAAILIAVAVWEYQSLQTVRAERPRVH
jgi:low temperature requirement protein LtrA